MKTHHMQHPDQLEAFVELQHLFLSDVLFDYTLTEITEWLSNLKVEEIQNIINQHPALKENGFVVPFTYLKYKAIPRREVVSYLRTLLDQNTLIPEENPIVFKTKKHFKQIFSERTDFRLY